MSYQVYQKLALQTEVTANYLRRLGIDAVPSNMNNYLTLMPQIVLDAGMGEISRMGIVLNPFLGCNCKYAAVLTNLELEVDGYVDFGLQKYCGKCTICADQCPSESIARGPKVLYNGYYTWKLDSRTCSDFDILNKEGCVCGRCTKVCPWNRPDMEPRDWAEWDGSLEWLHKTVDEQREAQRRQQLRRPARVHQQVVVPPRRAGRRDRHPHREERAEALPGVSHPGIARRRALPAQGEFRHRPACRAACGDPAGRLLTARGRLCQNV